MSIQSRRNSLFKSSISIRTINNAATKFSAGLKAARKNADEIIKTTRQRNIFKSKLVRNDNKFFRQRQENIRRKNREDELEASSVQGVPKTQGSILAKSTRGFLGRMLDFLGILLIGWAINNLPKIISGIQGLIKRISSVTGILGFFIDSIKTILSGIGTVIQSTLSTFLKFDFLGDKKEIEEGIEKTQTGLVAVQQGLVTAVSDFSEDPIASANLGLENPPGLDVPPPGTEKKEDEEGNAELEPPEITAEKKEIDKITDDIQKSSDDEEEKENVVEGKSEDVEGVKNNLESVVKEDASNQSTGGGGSSAFTPPSSEGLEDPTNAIKKKEKELLSKRDSSKSFMSVPRTSFLETPNSVEKINQSLTSKDLSQSNRGELVASLEITDEMKSQVLTPAKREIADKVTGKRKSKSTIIIMQQPPTGNNNSMKKMSGGGTSNMISKVDDEKLLMKMQSVSALKFF